MILYKYVDYEGGLEILKYNSIGFRQPINLNDPMELSAAYPQNDYAHDPQNTNINIRNELKKSIWKEFYVVLSLTRAPNNPLMWTHYSKNHTGFVIGFDVNNEFFSSEENNIIPVQYGSVIYTSTKPIHEIISQSERIIELGAEVSFIPERLETLQRVFLYKPMYWAYEEEVRVVKNIFKNRPEDKLQSVDFEIKKVNGNDLYIYKLLPNTIKEIHFGFKNPLINSQDEKTQKYLDFILTHSGEIKFYLCEPDENKWEFKPIEIRVKVRRSEMSSHDS